MRSLALMFLCLAACAQTQPQAQTQPEPVAAPPPAAATPDEQLLDAAETELKLWRQYSGVMYRRHYTLAKRYRDAMESEKALREVEKALRFRPTSAEARALHNDVRRMLGDRAGEVSTFLDDAWEGQRVKRAQDKVTIHRELALAKEAMAADDYDKARRAYERVLFIVEVSKREPPGPDRELLELGQAAGAALAKLRRK